MFARLYTRDRCLVSWLTHYYRSHPLMGQVVHGCIYRDILFYPRPAELFNTTYKSITGRIPLFPFTLIDTGVCRKR